MTDTHLSTDERVIIESYFKQATPVTQIAKSIKRSRQTVNNVVTYLKAGHSALEFYQRYQEKRGRQSFRRSLSDRDTDYPDYKDELGHLAVILL